MPSSTYTLFRNAILAGQQVVCTYSGRSRELCPHIIGTTSAWGGLAQRVRAKRGPMTGSGVIRRSATMRWRITLR